VGSLRHLSESDDERAFLGCKPCLTKVQTCHEAGVGHAYGSNITWSRVSAYLHCCSGVTRCYSYSLQVENIKYTTTSHSSRRFFPETSDPRSLIRLHRQTPSNPLHHSIQMSFCPLRCCSAHSIQQTQVRCACGDGTPAFPDTHRPKLSVALDLTCQSRSWTLTLSPTLQKPCFPRGSAVRGWQLGTKASRMTWIMDLQVQGEVRMSAWAVATDCYQLRGRETVAEMANHHD
jgi:hypothetical protein